MRGGKNNSPNRDRVNGEHSDIRDARWAVDGVENKTERIIIEGRSNWKKKKRTHFQL